MDNFSNAEMANMHRMYDFVNVALWRFIIFSFNAFITQKSWQMDQAL